MNSFYLIVSFIIGSAIGSFLNVVILRLPDEKQSIVFPGSHCPGCGHPIAWYENIPLLSFLLLRGQCRQCGVRISLQYPVVELTMALLGMALYLKFALSPALLIYFVFCAALLVIIFIDIHHQIIPDVISLPGILIGFATSFVNPNLTWQQSGLGIHLGGGILYGVAMGYFIATKRDGMGGGDIKLLAMIGAFLGWQSLLFIIFFSSLTGSIVGIFAMLQQGKGGQTKIPFGPFLSIAALVFLFFQQNIFALWRAYLGV
jgi:leader peptidase (prepilin peptidase)/N-methyltransferase